MYKCVFQIPNLNEDEMNVVCRLCAKASREGMFHCIEKERKRDREKRKLVRDAAKKANRITQSRKKNIVVNTNDSPGIIK